MRLLGRAPAICDVHHGAGKHTLHARHQRVIPLEASETRIEKCRTQRSASDSRPGASLGPVLAIFHRCDSPWWGWLVDMNSPTLPGLGSSHCCPRPVVGVADGGITVR